MAHHGGSAHQDLPATWPFRAAGTLLILALSWFCLGFAIEDTGEHLSGHMPVFWLLILGGLVLTVGGAVANVSKERRRRSHG